MFKRALHLFAFNARAQSRDDQALLDALVRKGVLSEKEADEISAEAVQGAVTTSAARINIGSWVQELNIGGDIRNRGPVGPTDSDDPDKSVVGASESEHSTQPVAFPAAHGCRFSA